MDTVENSEVLFCFILSDVIESLLSVLFGILYESGTSIGGYFLWRCAYY